MAFSRDFLAFVPHLWRASDLGGANRHRRQGRRGKGREGHREEPAFPLNISGFHCFQADFGPKTPVFAEIYIDLHVNQHGFPSISYDFN